jgi:hypothetical protein
VSLIIEPECATVGENWKLKIDPQDSNQGYVSVKFGFINISTAPADSASAKMLFRTVLVSAVLEAGTFR